MRIDEIAIDGFGRFHDVRYHPSPGLTVIRGDNEAGKSTLLAFIRAILFGFETDRHPALAGGTRGGWLRVTTSEGLEYRIERYSARGGAGRLAVRDADGVDRGPGLLPRILQGVEATVYRNVFAFGLEELSELKRLTDDEVAARIYGAGLGTGAASALEVEEQLRAEQRRIFLPSGENPRLNLLLRRVEEIDARLSARDLPGEYAARQQRLRELELELADLERRVAELIAARLDDERTLSGWPVWISMQTAEEELAALEDPGAVPEDALGTYAALSAEAQSAERELAALRRRRQTLEDRLERLTVDDTLLEQRAEIAGVLEDAITMRSRRAERESAERELAGARALAGEAIAKLGPGWDAASVADFDDSVAVRTAITGRFRLQLVAHDADVRRAEEDVRIAERELGDAQRRVDELEQLAGAPGTAREDSRAAPPLEERERGLRALDEALARLSALRSVEILGSPSAASGPAGRRAPVVLVGVGVAALAAASAAGLWFVGLSLLAAVAGLAGAATLIASAMLARRRRPGPAAPPTAPGRHAERIRAEEAAVRELAASLALPDHPEPVDLERLRSALMDERAAERRRVDLVEQLSGRERDRDAARGRLEAATARLREMRARGAAAVADWQTWLRAVGLSPELDPESAALLVEAVGGARARLDAVRDAEARARAVAEEERRAAERARRLLESVGRHVASDDALPTAIERLRIDLDATLAAHGERAAVQRELDETRQAESASAERHRGAVERLRRYLAGCAVVDEEGLRRKVALAERRRRAEREVSTQRTALTALSGPGDALDRFTADLRSVTDIVEVERRLADSRERLTDLTARRDAALQEIGELNAAIRGMEASVEATEDRQRRADLVAQLTTEAERWTVLALAIALLRNTRERFERQHRPAVLCSAERYLEAWTGGRYVRIVAPVGQQIEAVERRDGVRVPVSGLSRGTAEQLYLALRFGLVEHFAAEAEPLPLVMDEILVNFDDGRARAAARSIEELASRHQVLYFTCRDDKLLAANAEVRLEATAVGSVPGGAAVAVGPGERVQAPA